MVNSELVEEIECSMYVDDLISSRETTKQALEIKMQQSLVSDFKAAQVTFQQVEIVRN